MLTFSFEERKNESLYEFLYRRIKEDILTLKLSPNEKLPSKRALSKHLGVSVVTVENAYGQLLAEGYIYSKAKSGFYVSPLSHQGQKKVSPPPSAEKEKSENYFADLSDNSTGQELFPFSTWAKLMRETLSDNREKLTVNSPSEGIFELRKAIADYLFEFKNMDIDPSQIVVGAGTEYLYGLIIQLLGRDKIYALENPGYHKIARIYKANNVNCTYIPLDKKGPDIKIAEKESADIMHISPSHHFPTGIVTPISRRYEILSWAQKSQDRYIIEDEYDSEFRLVGRPIPTLQSIDENGKVIYINTFSKTLTSTIRISYMVLPESLMKKYRENLSFYSCTVSNFDQYTLASFIAKGYFEKHINRMRTFYRTRRDEVMTAIKKHPQSDKVQIKEENSGLHFLLQVQTALSDGELTAKAAAKGLHISCLSHYYHGAEKARQHVIIINYSSLTNAENAINTLFEII